MPDMPLVGEEFAGYRLVSVLGRGGMSTVFKAEHPRLGNEVALKVLDPSLADDDIFRTRFLGESRIAASMNHPHVIPIHDVGSSGGLLYIAMRCVAGTDLRQMLNERGRLQPDTSVFLLDQAARALDAAHRRGLVHRDVKPGNLLVEQGNEGTDPDHVYLADFGIAKRLGERTQTTFSGQFLGTIDYISPEQIRGAKVLGTADQYSLGCVMYECLTGRVPFEKDFATAIIWAHAEETPAMPSTLRPDLPPAIDDVFSRVLAKDPGDRYESCTDFIAAARAALGHAADPLAPSGSGWSLPIETAWSRPSESAWSFPLESVPEPQPAEPQPAEPQPAEPRWAEPQPAEPRWAEPQPAEPRWAEPQPAEPRWAEPRWAEPQPAAPQPAEAEAPPVPPVPPPAGFGPVPPPAGFGPVAPPAGFAPVPPPAGFGATYQPDTYVPQDWDNPRVELTRDPADQFQVPTNNWPPFGNTPPPPPVVPQAPPTPPAAPPSERRSRARGRGWLVAAAAALLLVVGGTAAAVTMTLTRNHGTASAGHPTVTAGGATRTGTAGAATASSAPSLAVPTIAEKITVGNTPSYVQVAPNGKFAYIANPGAKAVTVLNTANDQVSGTIKIPQGPPQFISFSPDSKTAYVSVYTTNGRVHLVAFINTATRTITATVQVNNFTPGPSTTSPDGRVLYVPNHNMSVGGTNDNVIDVIDTATHKLTGKITVLPNPHWVAFSANGRLLYATDHFSGKVTIINPSTNRVIGTISTGETPHGIAVSPDGSRLAVTSFGGNVVYIVDIAARRQIAQIPVGKNPLEVAYSPDGRYIFTANNDSNTVTVIDAADNHAIAEIPVGKAPTSISVLPNGHQAYVTDEGSGTITVLNIAQ